MKLSLLVLSRGKLHGQAIPVNPRGFMIGRAAGCHLRASSDLVSRHHCLVQATDENVYIQDLGSTNGTQVNGEKISRKTLLGDGDELKVGPLRFQLRVEQGVSVDQATPLPATKHTNRPLPTGPAAPATLAS